MKIIFPKGVEYDIQITFSHFKNNLWLSVQVQVDEKWKREEVFLSMKKVLKRSFEIDLSFEFWPESKLESDSKKTESWVKAKFSDRAAKGNKKGHSIIA